VLAMRTFPATSRCGSSIQWKSRMNDAGIKDNSARTQQQGNVVVLPRIRCDISMAYSDRSVHCQNHQTARMMVILVEGKPPFEG
jgi:hypothetical protein